MNTVLEIERMSAARKQKRAEEAKAKKASEYERVCAEARAAGLEPPPQEDMAIVAPPSASK
jgi:membrane protein involved in colicin uptake